MSLATQADSTQRPLFGVAPEPDGSAIPELLISSGVVAPFWPSLSERVRMDLRFPQMPQMGASLTPPRVSLAKFNQCLEASHPDIGLNTLTNLKAGTCDVIEFLAASSSTWGEALEIITKYTRILSDAAEYCLHEHTERAVFELASRTPLSRALWDFKVGLLAAAARAWLGHLGSFEFWFAHHEPVRSGEYATVFGSATLRFGAPCYAAVFDKALLARPLRHANAPLHRVLRRHADGLLAGLPALDMLSGRVRELVLELLPVGKSDVRHAAERLNMSRRTLARRLRTEGSSYRELVEEARHTLACRYLVMPSLDVKEIAFLLGYSETAAFSRAFRRWSGLSPLQYRDRQRCTRVRREALERD